MLGLLALMGFVLFVSFRIFTPPTTVVQTLRAPDGSREARLLHVYYYSDPGYKISIRSGRFWHTLFYQPEYAGAGELSLRWSDDAAQLYVDLNGRPIWGFDFPSQSRLRSP